MPRKVIRNRVEGAPDLPIVNETPGEIEPVTADKDLAKLAAEESFMNERVLIEVSTTTDENAMPYAHVNVNGLNQYIPRGMPVAVRRMFVEVLARMKESRYKQETADAANPDRIDMKERQALVFPFQVLKDDNPKGRAWLHHILSEESV